MTAQHYRDTTRPDTFGNKQELCEWIAESAGVPVDDVIRAKRSAAKQAGLEWRGTDPVGMARKRALNRLRSTSIRRGAASDTGTETRLTPPDSSTAARALRLMGRLS